MKPLLLLVFCAALLRGEGEELFPRLSPKASVSQTVGTTLVTVDYNRPAVKGRRIWGELVPFGQVWRAGANEATTIRFSDPVRVNGLNVPAGTYALFMIPGAESWTLILNKRARQFGAFEYQSKEDQIRFEVRPKTVKEHNEWLTYEVEPASRSSAYVDLYWEKLRVSFLVDVDVDALVTARMKRAMQRAGESDWKIYADAAEYFYEQERETSQALAWAEKSVRIQENPTNLAVKARLLHAVGRGPEALQTLERALKLARHHHAAGSVTGPLQALIALWQRQGMGNGQAGRSASK